VSILPFTHGPPVHRKPFTWAWIGGFLSDLERGKREPCLRTLEVVAQGFEVTVSRLLSRV
jgi:hypothetical protein